MGDKEMEGDNAERRALAKAARDAGETPSAVGASKQRSEASDDMSHQQRVDLGREGKHDVLAATTPEARTGGRDADGAHRESHPRLDGDPTAGDQS